MVKRRVYGKKTRNIAVTDSIFGTASSGPNSPIKARSVLSERSHNELVPQHDYPVDLLENRTPSKFTRSPTRLKACETKKSTSTPRKPKTALTKTPTAQPTRRSPRKAAAAAQLSQEDDLSTALSNLHLEPKPKSESTSHSLTPKSPPPPPPPPPRFSQPIPAIHRASVPASTLAHLSPILTCKNTSPIIEDFASWLSARSHLHLSKIGEGSYGEVYRATTNTLTTSSFTKATSIESTSSLPFPPQSPSSSSVILKLLPLAPPKGPGSKSFTTPSSAAREIQLLSLLQRVPGFVEFRGACILQGTMPQRLKDLWVEYKDSGRTVESRDPRGRGAWGKRQMWLVLEMSDAGGALEMVGREGDERGKEGKGEGEISKAIERKGKRCLSVRQTWDVWWGVVRALAKAEVYCEFEHRDLHLGNVCAKGLAEEEGKGEDDSEMVDEGDGKMFGMNRSGVEVTIIDYSLSRAVVKSEKDKEEVLFYDFVGDKQLLKGEGDLQYDVYRYMAKAIGRRCVQFVPKTNVLWLWFLLKKLMEMTKGLSEEADQKRGGRLTRVAIMRKALDELLGMIDPEIIDEWQTHSAGDLLDVGIERQWFMPEEILDN